MPLEEGGSAAAGSYAYLFQIPFVAPWASWQAFPCLFGGSLGWLFVVVMSNDSGQAPWAPIVAAIFGWPLALATDLLLLPFALLAQVSFAVCGAGHHDVQAEGEAVHAPEPAVEGTLLGEG